MSKKLNWGTGDDTSTAAIGKACYWTHPALPVGDFLIYGGNCGSPAHLDCHVYVALQSGSQVGLPRPWEAGFGDVIQVVYPIMDMHAPSDPKDFKKLVGWLCTQLQAGKKVHVGCIGGHGRTGLVLSAVVAQMMPDEPDAIGYVRKNYCKKAVESSSQVSFLVKHFGCKEVSGAKEGKAIGWGSQKDLPLGYSNGPSYSNYGSKRGGASEFSPPKSRQFAGAKRVVDPVPSQRNIFAVAA